MKFTFRIAAIVVWLSAVKGVLSAEPQSPPKQPAGNANLATATLGGKQFWADELVFREFRIQRNSFAGHYRLLDDKNVRRAWGSFDECRTELETIKRRDDLQPLSGKVVIVLHGLGRTRSSMSGMGKFLEENGAYTPIAVSYPSTMAEVKQHAKSLRRVVENLDGAEEVDFVAHSLGNLVIRHYLFDQTSAKENRQLDPRIKRIVMLGAPNNGAHLAVTVRKSKMVGDLVGVPVRELADGWNELSKHLATPSCEFGVIAGGKGDGRGYNPLLDGDDDLVVTVAETRLPGASDFIRLPVVHTLMMDDPAVQKATLTFLDSGYFVSEVERHPIRTAD